MTAQTDRNHSQVPQENPTPRTILKRRVARAALAGGVALGFVGLAVGGIVALQARASQETSARPHPPITVSTETAAFQNSYTVTTSYVGRLEPARRTDLAFERAGLVTEVAPEEGAHIRKGDVIARLDTSRLEASRRQLEARKRELIAERKLARLTLTRQKDLRRKGWTPQQREDEATTSVARLTAAIDQVSAQIDLTNIDLGKSVLEAPYDGVIGARAIDEGAVVTGGTTVVSLLETSRPQARIGLPPHAAASLSPDRTYVIRTDTGSFPARLASRRPDLQTGTRTVTALFDVNGANSMPFNEIVTLVVESQVDERGTWLPMTSLKEDRKGLWSVMVVGGGPSRPEIQSELVEVLHVRDEQVYVRGTLNDGARVVVNGTHRVIKGQRIALRGH